MRRSGQGSGGGYGNRQVKHVSAPKVEPRAYGRNPGAVAQYGNKVGNHVTSTVNTSYTGDPDVRARGYNAPQGITDPVKAVGVGGGREVMPAGGQGCHGQPARGNPPAQRGDILSKYGPESK